jgi:hypothetical protein
MMMRPGLVKPSAANLVYATWDPSNKQTVIVLSNGDLTAAYSGGAYTAGVLASTSKSTGKWYFECTLNSSGQAFVGITNTAGVNGSADNRIYSDASTKAYYQTGQKWTSGSGSAYGSSFTTNDVIGVAWDADNDRIHFAKNGTWQNSGDPVAGTNAAFTGLTGTFFPAIICYSGAQWTANFGASSFAYSPPSGFSGLTV